MSASKDMFLLGGLGWLELHSDWTVVYKINLITNRTLFNHNELNKACLSMEGFISYLHHSSKHTIWWKKWVIISVKKVVIKQQELLLCFYTFHSIRLICFLESLDQRSVERFRLLRRHSDVKIRFVTFHEPVQCKLTNWN